MSLFINNLERELNKDYTNNGAESFKSTLNPNLDLFGTIGSMRNHSVEYIETAFSNAYSHSPLTAMRTAFYARDIRGGLGERRVFRVILKWLAINEPESLKPNVKWIPMYGRWDDLYSLVGTPLEQEVISVMKAEVQKNGYNSLIWKWLKSTNTSSRESVKLGRWTAANVFNDTDVKNHFPVYRKRLKKGRSEVRVVESLMSANRWNQISYRSLTSYNNIRYIGAFLKHDSERYTDYVLNSESVDGSVLFPYDIIKRVDDLVSGHQIPDDRMALETKLYEKLWKSLPDYEVDSEESTIAVVDTSGSMCSFISEGESSVTARDVAISLGMYFAERAKGQFKDKFITFSRNPQLQKVSGSNIVDKYTKMANADWEMNTDLEAVFDLILETGINSKMDDIDMPKRLLIMSDMEFDDCTRPRALEHIWKEDLNDMHLNTRYGFINSMKEKYSNAGYSFPQLVFWNINANGAFHMTKNDHDFIMVSGSSPSSFKAVLSGEVEVVEEVTKLTEVTDAMGNTHLNSVVEEVKVKVIDADMVMNNTVHSERYELIQM